ncbi:RsiV family protein [Alistipes sp.]|uniref:RsiV family protein n=1 Tax=Alistipes sp. TaxID=1872444 RepID=UPI003A8A7D53
MKNRLVLLLGATLLFGACTKHPVLPDFSTRAIDTVLHGKANFCNIEYRFASIRNAAKSPALQTIEQANIGYFFQLEEFSGTLDQAVQTALSEIQTNFLTEGGNPTTDGYEISVEAEGSVLDSLLGYTITRAGYTGGAHGMYSTECHTYSLRDGFELSLADLFSDEAMQRLDALIREKIAEQYHATTDEELTEAGFFPEYIAPTENFLITPEGMTFYYNPYDIGCYALGGVIVTINSDELKDLRGE